MTHEQKLKQALQELNALKSKIEGLINPDKFAELKEAYRNGAVIQYKSNVNGQWYDNKTEPSLYDGYEYRIKPEEKTTLDQDIKALKEKYPNLKFTITVEDNL